MSRNNGASASGGDGGDRAGGESYPAHVQSLVHGTRRLCIRIETLGSTTLEEKENQAQCNAANEKEVERETSLELATSGLGSRRSTN